MDDCSRIKEALAKAHIHVEDIYDLVNSSQSYSHAIPILIELLSHVTNDRQKEGIIRALAVKEAKGQANKALLDEYNKIPKEKYLLRWAIGNTIAVIIDDSDIADIINIVKNKENGMSREMFVMALRCTNNKQAETVLIDLLDDEEVTAHAIHALAKSTLAREKIRNFLSHPKQRIRKEAEKVMNKRPNDKAD